jgi:hypothetical protein
MGKKTNESGIAAVAALLVILVVAVIGFAAFKISDKNKTTDDSSSNSTAMAAPTSDTKAAALRSTLVRLGQEHMLLTNTAVDQALDGSPSAAQSGAALYANGTDIGAAVGSVYGKDAETTFNTVWKLHLDDFVKYAVAGSKGDTAGKAAALKDIDTNYTQPLAAYLAKANPNLPKATLSSALADHVQMTADMIDAHNAKDYKAEYAKLAEADKHIEGLFSTLAAAIVKQNPSKF